MYTERIKMVQIKYYYKGSTYTRADKAAEALDRLESLTQSGARVISVEQYSVPSYRK